MRPRLVNRPTTSIRTGGHRLQFGEEVIEERAQELRFGRPRGRERHPRVGIGPVHADGPGRTVRRHDPPVIVIAAALQVHDVIATGAVRLDRGVQLVNVHNAPREIQDNPD